MASPSPQRPGRRNIPVKNLLVPSDAGEASVVVRDGKIEDFVAMSRIDLDQSRFRHGRIGFAGVVEMDGTI